MIYMMIIMIHMYATLSKICEFRNENLMKGQKKIRYSETCL